MERYLIFAVGLLVFVVALAPSLDSLSNNSSGFSSGRPASGEVGLPIVASPQQTRVPDTAQPQVGGGVALDRDAGGKFHIDAMVNNQSVRMLVDTGADVMALSEADAAAIGVAPDPSSFRPIAQTASGVGYAARVRIDRLEVAGHDLGAVDAVVMRGLDTSLLGQSVLRRLGPLTVSGDRMFIGNP